MDERPVVNRPCVLRPENYFEFLPALFRRLPSGRLRRKRGVHQNDEEKGAKKPVHEILLFVSDLEPMPNNLRALVRVTRPISSTGRAFSSAIRCAMMGMFAGSFRRPRNGTGDRYGLSVSRRMCSSGIVAATSAMTFVLFARAPNGGGPGNKIYTPHPMTRRAIATSPGKQWNTPPGNPRFPPEPESPPSGVSGSPSFSSTMLTVSSSASRL